MAPQPNAPGAVAALVLGIVAFVTWFIGFIPAILAIVFGMKARKAIQLGNGALRGHAMATAGLVLGWVYVGIASLVLAIIAIAFATGLGGQLADEAVEVPPGEAYMRGFYITADRATVMYTVTADTEVTAAFYEVMDPDNPEPASDTTWAARTGTDLTAEAVLPAGSYALMVTCYGPDPCDVHYTLRLDA